VFYGCKFTIFVTLNLHFYGHKFTGSQYKNCHKLWCNSVKICKLNKFYGFTVKIQKFEQFQKTFLNSKMVKKVKSWQNSILKLKTKSQYKYYKPDKNADFTAKICNFRNFKKLSSLEKVCVNLLQKMFIGLALAL
jgi:hypothetical protein